MDSIRWMQAAQPVVRSISATSEQRAMDEVGSVSVETLCANSWPIG